MPLFRKEVFEHKTAATFGSALVPTPLSIWFLSALTLILLIAIGAYLWWGQYARKVTVEGYLLPTKGLVRLYAPEQGIVSERKVRQGGHVHAGDTLMVITVPRSSTSAANVNQALAQAAEQSETAIRTQMTEAKALEQSQEASFKTNLTNLRTNLGEQRAQLDTQKKLLAILAARQKKYATLEGSGMMSEVDIKNAEQAWLQQEAQVQTLEQSITQAEGQIQSAQFQLAQAKINLQNQLAQYQQTLSTAEQQLTQYQAGDNFVLTAPTDGTVSAVLVQPGQTVSPQTPLVTMMPTGSKLEARLLVPASDVGFVKVGQTVRLRFDAFPYQNFGIYHGRVTEVSDAVFTPSELPVPLAINTAVYPVEVMLDSQDVMAYGRPTALQPGMSLSADVILARMRLIQWIFEPIYSLRGKV